MALPETDEAVIAEVVEEQAEENRQNAIAAVNSAVPAVSEADEVSKTDPMAFLAELGIEDIKLDFTSFPTVVLNKGKFTTAENKNFGESIQFVYMNKHKITLMSMEYDRDEDPLLAYSSDGLHCDNSGRALAEIRKEWEEKYPNASVQSKPYEIIIAMAVDGPHAGEIIQLQIPPRSQGKLSGYLYVLGGKKINPRSIVTEASIGAEVGSGQKAFTPWVFKMVGAANG